MMKLTNFTYIKKVAIEKLPFTTYYAHYARVDKTTGFLWWKKIETVGVFNTEPSMHWRFLDTGEHTPGVLVEALYEAYLAQEAFK